VIGETELDLDLYDVMSRAAPAAREELAAATAQLLQHFGAHSRSFVRALLSPAAVPAARKQ
jgi:hypothetical protein